MPTSTNTPHDHLTRARRHLYDAQQAVLDAIDPRTAACLTDARHSRAVELVELIASAIGHCERLMVDVEGHGRTETLFRGNPDNPAVEVFIGSDKKVGARPTSLFRDSTKKVGVFRVNPENCNTAEAVR